MGVNASQLQAVGEDPKLVGDAVKQQNVTFTRYSVDLMQVASAIDEEGRRLLGGGEC
jgi:hypothetical protein